MNICQRQLNHWSNLKTFRNRLCNPVMILWIKKPWKPRKPWKINVRVCIQHKPAVLADNWNWSLEAGWICCDPAPGTTGHAGFSSIWDFAGEMCWKMLENVSCTSCVVRKGSRCSVGLPVDRDSICGVTCGKDPSVAWWDISRHRCCLERFGM